jgi:predicted ArsR family transcriptional regulator
MVGWKDILTVLGRGSASVAEVGNVLNCSDEHARVLLERCRMMGTVRIAKGGGPPKRYELTDYGRRRVKAGFRRLGKWKVR